MLMNLLALNPVAEIVKKIIIKNLAQLPWKYFFSFFSILSLSVSFITCLLVLLVLVSLLVLSWCCMIAWKISCFWLMSVAYVCRLIAGLTMVTSRNSNAKMAAFTTTTKPENVQKRKWTSARYMRTDSLHFVQLHHEYCVNCFVSVKSFPKVEKVQISIPHLCWWITKC